MKIWTLCERCARILKSGRFLRYSYGNLIYYYLSFLIIFHTNFGSTVNWVDLIWYDEIMMMFSIYALIHWTYRLQSEDKMYRFTQFAAILINLSAIFQHTHTMTYTWTYTNIFLSRIVNRCVCVYALNSSRHLIALAHMC